MESITAPEVRDRFSELLERVGRGEAFQITKDGRTVARLVPSTEFVTERTARAVELLKSFHEDMPEVPLADILESRHKKHHL